MTGPFHNSSAYQLDCLRIAFPSNDHMIAIPQRLMVTSTLPFRCQTYEYSNISILRPVLPLPHGSRDSMPWPQQRSQQRSINWPSGTDRT